MNTLIPAQLYYPLYINLALFIILFIYLHGRILDTNDRKNINFINFTGFLLLFFLIIYIGLRPIHYLFGDTVNYNVAYTRYANGGLVDKSINDYGWHLFMKFMSNFMNIHIFFTVCSFIYIFPLYKISKVLFKEYWFYSFLMFIVSFSFWTYSVNGVRNGLACSLFLWGLCYKNQKILMFFIFFIAASFHKTVLLPIFAYLLTYLYNDPKTYMKIWLSCIPLSLILGSVWISIFANLGFGGDDRLSGYLTSESSAGTFKSTGFRWDFLFHSAFAVFAGWFFIIKKGFNDKFYNQLLNTYLICNSFWILVIKANFSNRFAYLSWFMMALVIIYPVLKKHFFDNQNLMIAKILLIYFSFTYAMYYLYY